MCCNAGVNGVYLKMSYDKGLLGTGNSPHLLINLKEFEMTEVAAPNTDEASKEAFVPVTHTFTNGEVHTFAKANHRMKKTIELMPKNKGVIVHFMFSDGTEQACTVTAAHENHWMFTGHGVSAKIGDASSGRAIKELDDAKAEVARMIAQTETTWNIKRAGGSGNLSLFTRAIAKLKEMPLEEAQEKVSAMDEATLKRTKSLDIVKRTMDLISFKDQEAKMKAAEGTTTTSTADDIVL